MREGPTMVGGMIGGMIGDITVRTMAPITDQRVIEFVLLAFVFKTVTKTFLQVEKQRDF